MLGLLSLFAVLAVSNAGLPPSFDPRIINGEDVKPGEIPFQVSLQSRGSHFCGGSVLNANYVLTAAHCVDGKTPSTVEVIAGTVNLDGQKSVHKAQKLITHEKYDSTDSWKNDVALIKVSPPFVKGPQISFVPLPKPNEVIPAKSVATVSGWGRTSYGGQLPKKLQKAKIIIADQSYCAKVYKSEYMNIYDSQICAYDPTVERGSCNGDSGGPLTVNGKIVGLVSWAMGCALTNYPTVYTRVPSFLDWINKHAV